MAKGRAMGPHEVFGSEPRQVFSSFERHDGSSPWSHFHAPELRRKMENGEFRH